MPESVAINTPEYGSELQQFQGHTNSKRCNSIGPLSDIYTILPVVVEPDKPTYTVQSPNNHIHLHIITIVKLDTDHRVGMVYVEQDKHEE